MAKVKYLSLRIDAMIHRKILYISRYEGRSMNRQILHLMKKYISVFEEEHGAISFEEQEADS